MLFKNLKAIINEADEAPAPADAVAPATPAAPVKRQPAKTIKVSQENSDGVGKEAYNISNELAQALSTTLKQMYNIMKVDTNDNTITIIADPKKMVDADGVASITSKLTGKPVDNASLISTIQQLVTGTLGLEIDKFNLTGPTQSEPGVLLITVVSVA